MPVKSDIIKAIHSYIYRESVQHAIMIDGVWGIGKTHFIRNEVIPVSPHVEFIYLSLYGIKSLEKLENLIQSKLKSRNPAVIQEWPNKSRPEAVGETVGLKKLVCTTCRTGTFPR